MYLNHSTKPYQVILKCIGSLNTVNNSRYETAHALSVPPVLILINWTKPYSPWHSGLSPTCKFNSSSPIQLAGCYKFHSFYLLNITLICLTRNRSLNGSIWNPYTQIMNSTTDELFHADKWRVVLIKTVIVELSFYDIWIYLLIVVAWFVFAQDTNEFNYTWLQMGCVKGWSNFHTTYTLTQFKSSNQTTHC